MTSLASPRSKAHYVSIYSNNTKKVTVAARRIGAKERMNVIAICTDETSAETIVEALNFRQGSLNKLAPSVEKELLAARNELKTLRAENAALERRCDNQRNELAAMQNSLKAANAKLETAGIDKVGA